MWCRPCPSSGLCAVTGRERGSPGSSKETFAPLLEGHPDLDQVIPVRLRAWRKRPFAKPDFAGARRLLQQPRSIRSGSGPGSDGQPQGRCTGRVDPGRPPDRRRQGLSSGTFERHLDFRDRSTQISSQCRQDAGGARRPRSAPRTRRIRRSAPTHRPDRQDPIDETGRKSPVLIHPGAGWDNKRYPPEKWGEVAYLIHQATGARCGIVIARGEENLAQAGDRGQPGCRRSDPRSRSASADRHPAACPHWCWVGTPDPSIWPTPWIGRFSVSWDPRIPGPVDPTELPNPPSGASCRAVSATNVTVASCPVWRRSHRLEIADRAQRVLANRPLPGVGPVEEGESGCLVLH